MRLHWEDVYKQPSLGNPIFENVAVEEWYTHLLAKHLRAGGGARLLPNGSVEWLKQDEGDSGTPDATFTGDEETDTMERRIALGLDVEDDDGDAG